MSREGSPLGATPEVLRERLEWLSDEHQVALHLDLAQADVMVAFSSVEIMKYPTSLVATARVMEHAGYPWTLSSQGYEATNFGMLAGSAEWQRESSEKLIGAAIACKAKTVVLPECGHAYTALRWQGANIHGGPLPFRVLHISEFLDEGIAHGRIRVRPQEASVTFHDPCQLSRRGGAAAAPRLPAEDAADGGHRGADRADQLRQLPAVVRGRPGVLRVGPQDGKPAGAGRRAPRSRGRGELIPCSRHTRSLSSRPTMCAQRF